MQMQTIAVQSDRLQKTTRLDGVIIILLFSLGLYFPSSIGTHISKVLLGIFDLLCLTFFVILLARSKHTASFPACASLLSVVPLLLVFTYTSGLHTYTYGTVAVCTLLAFLYMTNLAEIRLPNWFYYLYIFINILNIGLCVGVLTGSSSVGEFLTAHYSVFHDELVPTMVMFRKPVLTFGTHSLAGFFLYLFFYVNLQTYRLKGGKLFLSFALCYLFLTLSLLSVTGIILGLVGMVQIFYYLGSSIRHRWLWISGIAVSICMIATFDRHDVVAATWIDIAGSGKAILMSQVNGFLGRIRPDGTMYYAIQYLKAYTFAPVGASEREGLMFVDSGWIDYLIRGSVIFLVWAYGGLFFFLKRSLLAKSDLYWLFGLIVAFESGFSSLSVTRTVYLIPFFVVYMNALRQSPMGARRRI